MNNVPKVIPLSLKERMILLYSAITLIGLIMIDLLADYDSASGLKHFLKDTLLEIGILSVAIFMTHYLWSRFVRLTTEQQHAEEDLRHALSTVRELEVRERVAASKFGHACDLAFEQWQFTKAESEIAHHLLGAKSLKDIAAFRFTSEGTLKNQARSIYSKAGVKNRVEFMASLIGKLAPS